MVPNSFPFPFSMAEICSRKSTILCILVYDWFDNQAWRIMIASLSMLASGLSDISCKLNNGLKTKEIGRIPKHECFSLCLYCFIHKEIEQIVHLALKQRSIVGCKVAER